MLDGIRHGRALPDILAAASLPQVLRDHPAAVVPYLVTRDHFTARLYHQLMERYQLSDPFKFLSYAELADAELGPVG